MINNDPPTIGEFLLAVLIAALVAAFVFLILGR